ncbi:chromosome segregation protein SMC [Novispirillum sp. DQ9]|uniref:chromosome segregation protein SMC n=1 Tax=Novispirillum sp. DQ9 TaxID=3398612 RepID=UPI003C7A1643
MIQFTRLRLAGFKSFVDPTELLIEPGMTGVVGPNGCGKSNLVEALRWVMGETSAKQMRGGEMDDVIFGGTSHRPARNLAEVTLVLDNALRAAPALFNDVDDIEVTRRIERGDGSTYRFNGKEVRAKDVQLLFADAATGARSTAMVSQGRVGQLISAKPAQRRSLLEEAAGIAGLHTRRHEAELRLKAAESNLERLSDVLSALDTQLGSLRRQARQAQRYRQLSDDIRTTEATLLYMRWAEAVTALDQARTAEREAEREVARLTGLAAEASKTQALAAHALKPLRDAEAEAAARLQRLIVAREQLDAEERRLAEARTQAERRMRQIADDVERERARAQDADAALERLEEERLALEEAREGEEDVEFAAADRVETLSLQVEDLEARLAELTERLAAEEAARAAARRRLEDARVRVERLARRLDDNEGQLAQARRDAGDGLDLEAAREALEEATLTVEDRRLAAEEAEERQSAARAAHDEAREALQRASADRARLRAEAEALEAVLAQSSGTAGGDWPPVLDAVAVQPGYERALGAALGDDLSVPADAAEAPAAWDALPPFAAPPALPTGVESLAGMVEAPAVLARRLSQIGLVTDGAAGDALRHDLKPGQRLVTRAGDLWRWDGYRSRAGAAPAGASAAVRLEQRNRLRDLRGALDEAEAVVAAAAGVVDGRRAAAEAAAAALAAARDAARAAESALARARDAHADLARKAAAAESRLAALAEQGEQLAADLAEARADMEEARLAVEDGAAAGASRAEADGLRATLAEHRAWLTEARSALERVRRDAADRTRRLGQIADEIAGWRRRKDGASGTREELDARQAEVADELRLLTERPVEIAEQRLTVLDAIEDAEAARAEAGDALAAAETGQREADAALRAAEQAAAKAREDKVRAEAAVAQGDQFVRQVSVALKERLDCTPLEAKALAGLQDGPAGPPPVPPVAELESRLHRLVREREAMGPVNLRAEQEAAELDDQRGTLAGERDDLIAAIARLRQGINELNREGRARLLASFEKVDTHFRRLFVRLFGGGRAHLALTESDDPLQAGLEIFASPPGKRLQVLSLLSGGEQAMTALALLFAVFLVNPAPICVLDEVDAPLDDANVDRFCSMLDELTRNNQAGTRFLVVTHHRMTMARMDRLYGVTMAERGVSKLVSVDLREAEALRETA